MKIPAFELTRQNKLLGNSLVQVIQRVISEGHFILGEDLQEFEAKIGEYLGVRYAYGVANGSDALVLALLALGIKPGDEVLVPAFTFFATAGAVSRIGARPVFVDVNREDYNIDLVDLERKIGPHTKAVIPVHLFGSPANLDSLIKVSAARHLAVVEDAAQALGSTFQGTQVGTIGDIGCFSFFPTKNLGCFGDGGLVVTNNPDYAAKLRMLRVHGASKKYYHELLGINSRLDTIQAAILNLKLPRLNGWIESRRRLANRYRQGLKDLKAIKLPAEIEGHSYNQFTIATLQRDSLREFLTEQGIGTTVYYPLSLHLQPVFGELGYNRGDLPVAESLTEQVLSLPIFPELSEAEQEYIIQKVQEFFRREA